MNAINRPASVVLLGLPLLLSGCSLLPTTRKLPVPKAPSIIKTATPDELVAQLNKHWEAMNALTATVDIQATQLKTNEGLAKDFPSCRGYIVVRKPEMLRVVGQYFGVRIFDMGSDGKTFTLYIPSKSKVVKGDSSLKKKSDVQLENLRPGFFFDAMVVRGVEPQDEIMVTVDSETLEDTAKKHLYTVPEYTLNVMRRKVGSRELKPERVVTFHREDLLPYEQDVYDSEGNVETHVTYANYQYFDAVLYPGTITIKRPLEGFQIVMTIVKVTENMSLTDDQFLVKFPDGTEIQNLE